MRKILILLFFIYGTAYSNHPVQNVEKVVMWGHKLGSHTHSYIHWGFYRAFESLGYKTHWFDSRDTLGNFDFSNSLFITEGHVDRNIPIRDDCYYVIHNCQPHKYQHLLKDGHAIILQVYSHDCIKRNEPSLSYCFHYDIKQPVIYMPWATDLLPQEIDKIIEKLPTIQKKSNAQFNGSQIAGRGFGNQKQLSDFRRACGEDGRTFNTKSACSCSMEENIRTIQEAFLAPALQGEWQCANGYIPCRIFKNISYGAMGVTNSEAVYKLFDKKIVYNSDSYQLYHDAKKKAENWSLEDQKELMRFVRDNHTYVNRIQSLFHFFEMVEEHKKGTSS